MKKIFSFCFDKWWRAALFSLMLIGLLFIFDSIWFALISIFLITVSVIYQITRKRWKIVFINGTTMLVIICLSFVWFISQIFLSPENIFPSPEETHRLYSGYYENRTEIQRILGVKTPEFEIIDSQLKHFRNFDFEFKAQSTIEFKILPDDKFFYKLDSICKLPVPQEPDESSSYFYYSLESINSC